MIRQHKINCFTLIEVLLVLSLSALVFGSITFAIFHVIGAEHFSQAIKKIEEKITLAEQMALDFKADVIMKIETTQKGLRCTLHGDERIPHALLNACNKESIFPALTTFAWNLDFVDSRTLLFGWRDYQIPAGTLTFQSVKQSASITISTHWGYHQQKNERDHNEEAPYPQEVLSIA